MNQDQLNKHCAAYNNIDGATLHTDHPGNTGANDSGVAKEPFSAWPDPVTGVMSATADFDSVPPGEYPYAGVWDGSVFIEAVAINLVVGPVAIPFHFTLEHHAKVR